MANRDVSSDGEKRLAYRRESAAWVLSVSTDTIDRLVARGELATVRIGSARLILATELEAFLERKVAEQAGGAS